MKECSYCRKQKIITKIDDVYGPVCDECWAQLNDGTMVESVNILSGKKIKIEAHLKGTCCDPGTERYHCM